MQHRLLTNDPSFTEHIIYLKDDDDELGDDELALVFDWGDQRTNTTLKKLLHSHGALGVCWTIRPLQETRNVVLECENLRVYRHCTCIPAEKNLTCPRLVDHIEMAPRSSFWTWQTANVNRISHKTSLEHLTVTKSSGK
jgi:hypothetical protein